MARLRILELPEGASDERPPFAIVIDEIGEGAEADYLRGDLAETDVAADRIGARCILGFTGTIDIPEADHPVRMVSVETPADNPEDPFDPRVPETIDTVRDLLGIDMTQGPSDITGVLLTACGQLANSEAARDHLRQETENLRGRSEALEQRLREVQAAYRDALGLDNDEAIDSLAAARDMRRDLADARSWARHGYEIGQRHCGWSDHGVAPAWLTGGWPPHIDSCEHATRAAGYDTTLSQVRTLASKRLDEDECSPQERSGYHDAMRMVLALMDDNYDGRTVEPDGEDE
ncbi:hypothetical protein OG900_33295 [Streptomyces sp. NBC_00433]